MTRNTVISVALICLYPFRNLSEISCVSNFWRRNKPFNESASPFQSVLLMTFIKIGDTEGYLKRLYYLRGASLPPVMVL